ncbi:MULTISPECIES: hypothetical protein [Peptoniphilus]|uniref:hypothetical protein n=1 Tax=Peptoniphilus TaxID=162289 RepID=UPI0001DA9C55|nr:MULTISPECIES: hypothetical protein [Peptoniphilus]EFI42630.1 hypothetical protein HMPREF0629_01289 [Peptoniphilus sp. oral taxon 386 str. F0131]
MKYIKKLAPYVNILFIVTSTLIYIMSYLNYEPNFNFTWFLIFYLSLTFLAIIVNFTLMIFKLSVGISDKKYVKNFLISFLIYSMLSILLCFILKKCNTSNVICSIIIGFIIASTTTNKI